jgi:predicted O-linked N-acetylglucosamine transferase (SPINDLY family)
MLRRLRRPDEALACCTEILRSTPNDVEALHLRARASLDAARPEAALEDLDRALQLQPAAPAILLNRGNVLFQLERVGEALASYQRSLELSPGNAEAHFNSGNALLSLKRYDEALRSYDEAIAVSADFAKAHYYRGNALRRLKRPEESLASYARALHIDPCYAEAVCGIGNAQRDLNQVLEALAHYDQALQLDPQCAEAAIVCLERLFEAVPDCAAEYNYALGMMLHARLMCCDWRDYEPMTAALVVGVNRGRRVTQPSLFTAASESLQAQLQCARMFVEDNWSAVAVPSWSGTHYAHERIRLAYISADFREHPVSLLMTGVFETHDRERFDVIAISLRAEEASATGRRVKAAFDRFIDVTKSSDQEVASLLRQLEIDVAVDLTGYTDGCRPGIFAHRAAPVQVNYLGYPGTLAAPYIDYLIADDIVVPAADKAYYTEKIVYLPHCYQPNDAKRTIAEHTPIRTECGLPERGFVFCCFNSHFKITPTMFDVWMRLVRANEGSVLWLAQGRDSAMRNLRQEAITRGIAEERLVFAPRLPDLQNHLARYRLADLFLDTLPFNAHTTASDALWAGLPVLTCRGRSMAARVASSLLTAIDLPELISSSVPDYETRALRLAATPALLAQLRARLAHNRTTHPLFDADGFRKHLEAAYTTMWQRSLRGHAPESFAVPALA